MFPGASRTLRHVHAAVLHDKTHMTQRADIAVTIVGGQTLCLFLTLLLVPVSYSLAEEGVERWRLLWRARIRKPEPARGTSA